MDNKAVKKSIISILVRNEANVTTRVSSLFGRRGFNITSFTGCATNDPKISRITVAFEGTKQALHQILTQTAKLEDVIKIFTMDDNSIYRELLLMKVKADKSERSAIMQIVEIYRGKIVDLSRDSLIIEMTGSPEKLDGFMDMMNCYDIAEVSRTGVTGMSRGLELEG